MRRLRQEHGLTLAQLSERLGDVGRPITVGTLSKMELGQRGIDVDDLMALASALEAPLAHLMIDPAEQAQADAVAAVDRWRIALADYEAMSRNYALRVEDQWREVVAVAKTTPEALEAVRGHLDDEWVERLDREMEVG